MATKEEQISKEHRRILVNEYCRNVAQGNPMIKCDECTHHSECVEYGWKPNECKMFEPIVLTNKEYYTETDEALAGFLSRTCQDLLASVVEDGGSVPNEYIEEDREFWLEWLKEKHNA